MQSGHQGAMCLDSAAKKGALSGSLLAACSNQTQEEGSIGLHTGIRPIQHGNLVDALEDGDGNQHDPPKEASPPCEFISLSQMESQIDARNADPQLFP